MDSGSRITAVENVPADTTFLFTVREIETDGLDLSSASNVEF